MVVLLLLPFISATAWQKVIKSRILRSLENQSFIYFNVFIVILVLFFIDAIRDVRRYTGEMEDLKHDTHGHFETEMQTHMKLFRAQRNFYISGFALFLWLVLRRLVTLISSQATLIASNAAAMKQAQNATDTAQKLLNEKEKRQAADGETADNVGNVKREEYEKEINDLRKQLKATRDELDHARVDVDSMKKQAESVTKEYDRLLAEFDKKQAQGDKKGD